MPKLFFFFKTIANGYFFLINFFAIFWEKCQVLAIFRRSNGNFPEGQVANSTDVICRGSSKRRDAAGLVTPRDKRGVDSEM